MKKGISFLLVMILIIFISFEVYIFKGRNNSYIKSNYHDELILKGIEGATAITFDNNGNIYIALYDRILLLDKNRQKKTLLKTDNIPIYDLEYFDDRLYYTYGVKLGYYDLVEKNSEIILDNLPNIGDYKENKILIKDNSLFLAIGASTNSGIVDDEGKPYDLSPKKLILSGRNYKDNTLGPFVSYGKKVTKGEEVKAEKIGNASIIKIDLISGKNELYCYGIRNVEGIDYNSEGKIYSVVGGIENRGNRALFGDIDYIYEINGDETWYGWPDYSGGDPVNSPRFRHEGSGKVNFILENHPDYSPQAPFYQHDKISSLITISVDREGVIGEKNSLFTFDKTTKELINILKEGATSSVVKFCDSAELTDIKFQDESLYLLDCANGYLVKVYKQVQSDTNKVIIYSFFLVLSIFMIIILTIKLFKEGKK